MEEKTENTPWSRAWIIYTVVAALIAGYLVYQQRDRSQTQKHFETGTSFMRLITEPEAKERAMRHLRIAAEQGHTEAQRVLGGIYLKDYEDDKRPEDAEAARHWLEMASKAGNDEALALLRILPSIEDGEGPE